MSTLNKLTTLGHLKSLATIVKSEDDKLAAKIAEVVADVEGIVATGGEANVLEGMKVNGQALAITDKMVDLLIEAGEENGTINVNGAAVTITGLQNLAFKANISESDLDEALKASIAAKATNADLEALTVRVTTAEGEITEIKGDIESLQNAGYQNAEQVQSAIQTAIAASGHAHFEKVDAIPEASAAEENIMYLVPADDGDGFIIYAKIGESVEPLGHTKVDLSGYSTTEQMNAAISAAVEALNIGDYAKAADLVDALARITTLEEQFANYYTKEEAEAKFTDEAETQTIAENAVAAAVATDEEFNSTMEEVWTPEA